jgi:hypothetical protein
MNRAFNSFVRVLSCCLLVFCFNLSADDNDEDNSESSPWEIKEWRIQTSLYTKHFDPDPDHVNNQNLIGLEVGFENNWLAGAAFFQNSFGQDSQYIFMGKTWSLFSSKYWYFKLTGGLLHGYKEPYEDKIPLNGLGIAPAILPALGFKYKMFLIEANLAGTAAMTITAGIAF